MSRAGAFLTTIAALVVIIVAILVIKGEQIAYMIDAGENYQQPPETVSAVNAEEQVWSRNLRAVGTVEAFQGLTLRSEISGRVSKIHFESGQMIKAGDVLVEQESGNEEAQLRAAKSRLTLASNNLKRLVSLREQQSVSQSALDEAEQQLESAKGDVDNLSTTLRKKRIVAPFDGRLGIRQVYTGQDLQAGTAIVSLQSIDKLRVNFNVPQQWLKEIEKGYTVSVDNRQGDEVSGEVFAIAAEIDQATRNLQVQAIIPNNNKIMLPGMSVDVQVELPNPNTVLAVPISAVLFAPYGDTVFVIEPAKKGEPATVRQQFVRLGKTRGDYVAVEAGLEVGQRIVSAGAFKLFNGMKVVEGKLEQPEYKLDPQPSDA